jgi:hypothetical protein
MPRAKLSLLFFPTFLVRVELFFRAMSAPPDKFFFPYGEKMTREMFARSDRKIGATRASRPMIALC